MEDKKRVYCISNLVEGLTKDKVYKVEYIHHGQTVYYDIVNDDGVKSTHNANDFMDTKQVVVAGYDNCSGLLTPYYMAEYFKRKGKELSVFTENENSECYLVNNDKLFSEYNDFNESYYNFCYSYIKDSILSKYDSLKEISREDETLIQIAKEINNEMYLKIIYIPYNVNYDVKQWECTLGEYISEKHRRWC